MNKNQLIEALAARYNGNKRAARHALESVLDTIGREVAKGEKVSITGFGSFEKRVRNARMVRNPRTGERIKAKATTVPAIAKSSYDSAMTSLDGLAKDAEAKLTELKAAGADAIAKAKEAAEGALTKLTDSITNAQKTLMPK